MPRSSTLALAGLALLAAALSAVPGPVRADDGAAPASTADAPAVPKPDGDDFVVTDDGAVFTGDVSETDTEVLVTTPSGGEHRLPKIDVSVAISGGKRIHKGEEAGLRRAWLNWLTATHVDTLPTKRLADATPEQRAAWWADVLTAARACGELKMRYAAAALLAEGIDEKTWDDEAQSLAIELEPLEFPFTPEDSERSRLWATWAREIVPLGGKFVLKKEGLGISTRPALWVQQAIALRTRNLEIWSIDKDPKVVGSLLRQGEATVRALESLFGRPEYGNDELLEIRLFRDRKQYLTESDSGGGFAPMWSAGFFSPGEHVSRFYVDRKAKTGEFMEGELHEVLSHELTHHWTEVRFLRGIEFAGLDEAGEKAARSGDLGRKGDQPGHWIVEGVARFVEDQAILWKKTGIRFDTVNAECVNDHIAAWKSGIAIPMARYVDITPQQFQFLSDRPSVGKGGYMNTERGIFYDEGGTLAFFMMNRRGVEGRKLFVEYLKDVYAGKMEKDSWKRLGFTSAAELEKEFTAFLAAPNKK